MKHEDVLTNSLSEVNVFEQKVKDLRQCSYKPCWLLIVHQSQIVTTADSLFIAEA